MIDDKYFQDLEAEITATKQAAEREHQRERLMEQLKTYRGEDKIESSLEIAERLKTGDPIPCHPTGITSLDNLLRGGFRSGQLIVVAAITKHGKCLGADELVMKYDGSKIKVQDIVVGDELMGPDGTARKVQELGSGTSEMYRVYVGSESFVCNGEHILPMRSVFGKREISVNEYIQQNRDFKKRFKCYFSDAIEFKYKELPVNPYIFGVWLGDGTSAQPAITNIDPEVWVEVSAFAEDEGYTLTDISYNRTNTLYIKGGFKQKLQMLGVIKNKHIPQLYKKSSVEQRLELLAGLVDTDGYLGHDICGSEFFEITILKNQLAYDIVDVVRSLGFSARVGTRHIKDGTYLRITIRGDLGRVPVRIERKKSTFVPKRDYLATSIKVESLGVGKYYGFTLDGDGLFLLGNFIVSHNTEFCTFLTAQMKEQAPLWFSYEDGAEELVERFVDRKIDVPLFYAPATLKQFNLEWMEERIVESIVKFNTKIVFIDNLQCLVPRSQNQATEYGFVTRKLKTLAEKWGVAIVLVHHLTKVQLDRVPDLNDIKGSSDVAQDASTVILLWRQNVRTDEGVVTTENVLVDVAAVRRGKPGKFKMTYNGSTYYEHNWNENVESFNKTF